VHGTWSAQGISDATRTWKRQMYFLKSRAAAAL
jgi:hypothetical protein